MIGFSAETCYAHMRHSDVWIILVVVFLPYSFHSRHRTKVCAVWFRVGVLLFVLYCAVCLCVCMFCVFMFVYVCKSLSTTTTTIDFVKCPYMSLDPCTGSCECHA